MHTFFFHRITFLDVETDGEAENLMLKRRLVSQGSCSEELFEF